MRTIRSQIDSSFEIFRGLYLSQRVEFRDYSAFAASLADYWKREGHSDTKAAILYHIETKFEEYLNCKGLKFDNVEFKGHSFEQWFKEEVIGTAENSEVFQTPVRKTKKKVHF